jgi:hypothetical protein
MLKKVLVIGSMLMSLQASAAMYDCGGNMVYINNNSPNSVSSYENSHGVCCTLSAAIALSDPEDDFVWVRIDKKQLDYDLSSKDSKESAEATIPGK